MTNKSLDPSERIAAISWSISDLPEAFEALALHAGLPRRENTLPPKPAEVTNRSSFKWIRSAAAALDFDIQTVSVSGLEIDAFMIKAAPAFLVFGPGDALASSMARVLVLTKTKNKYSFVITPDGGIVKVESRELAEIVLAYASMHQIEGDARVAQAFESQPAFAQKLLRVLAKERRSQMTAGRGYLLKLSSTRSMFTQIWHDGAWKHLIAIAIAVLLSYACSIGAWIWLSDVALNGHIDRGRIAAWGLLLLTTVPFELALAWAAGNLTLRVGLLLRKRLLEGTFRLPLDQIRDQGVGASVTLANEPEVLEESVLTQGILTLSVGLDFVAAAAALIAGPDGLQQAVAYLAVWCLAIWAATGLQTASKRVVSSRGSLTAELVDRLVGHRTRAVQQPRERWHEGEDEPLADYAVAVRILDARRNLLRALPRAWLVIGSAIVFFMFVFDRSKGVPLIGLIGVVLGQQSFTSFSTLIPGIALSRAAYQRLEPLMRAGFIEDKGGVDASVDVAAYDEVGPVIQGIDIDFEHRVGGRKILNQVQLTIEQGDRILVEGPSGGGKSTLASVLAGLRRPTSGVLLVRGLDQHTLDDLSWRRVVATAPQFHENFIFSKTLTFNLLASRRWPASPGDIQEAEQLCRELGLGPLLDRMPAGMQQLVGSTGWQLSHGERSRVFIARALLQNAPLVILDESFGALDSETLRETVECVMRRAPSLMVIAHS